MTIATTMRRTVYVGTFIHSASLKELDVLEDAAVAVDDGTGKILLVKKDVTEEVVKLWEGETGTRVVRAGKGQFFFPGFIGMFFYFLLLCLFNIQKNICLYPQF